MAKSKRQVSSDIRNQWETRIFTKDFAEQFEVIEKIADGSFMFFAGVDENGKERFATIKIIVHDEDKTSRNDFLELQREYEAKQQKKIATQQEKLRKEEEHKRKKKEEGE